MNNCSPVLICYNTAMKRAQQIKTEKPKPYKPQTQEEKNLIHAFSVLKNEQEIANFLRDLLSPAEFTEFSNRFRIAELLLERKKSYLEIADEVGTSTTTVTRVSQWLFRGSGGYMTILERIKK